MKTSALALGFVAFALSLTAQRATKPPQPAKEHPPAYTFQIVAQDGDVIDGKKILRFAAAGPASPGAALLEDGFSLNNGGQIAFNAVTSDGPAMFISELSGGKAVSRKALVSAGARVSGHEVISFGRPVLNSAKPPQVAYLVKYRVPDCATCSRDGLAIGDELKLQPGTTTVPSCEKGVVQTVTKPAINSAGSYAAVVTVGFKTCVVKDGVALQLSNPFPTSDLRVSEEGPVLFASTLSKPGSFLCVSERCDSLLPPYSDGVVVNDKRQYIYMINRQLHRGGDNLFLRARYGSYAMNDKGLIAVSDQGLRLLHYDDDALAKPPDYGPYVAALDITNPNLYKTFGVPDRNITYSPQLAINNDGQVAFMASYTEANFRRHDVLVVGTPHGN